jgi:hypothetical protein
MKAPIREHFSHLEAKPFDFAPVFAQVGLIPVTKTAPTIFPAQSPPPSPSLRQPSEFQKTSYRLSHMALASMDERPKRNPSEGYDVENRFLDD